MTNRIDKEMVLVNNQLILIKDVKYIKGDRYNTSKKLDHCLSCVTARNKNNIFKHNKKKYSIFVL